MNDLKLDTITNDIDLSGMTLTVVEGGERVRQQLFIKLSLWEGEWFLDTEFGTPYLQDILGKQVTLAGAIAAMKVSILEVFEVTEIITFSYFFDRKERKLTIEFEYNTPYGIGTIRI